jgi:methylglutaconyl-CoA hydratase
MMGIKRMLQQLGAEMTQQQMLNYTTDLLAQYRNSPEGQEGMRAFLEKRRPAWRDKKRFS